MAAALGNAGNVVQVINPRDLERHVPAALDDGQRAPRIEDTG
jgi:hypothetical protein